MKAKRLDQRKTGGGVCRDLNIADILTRVGTPGDLKENSIWQNGREFLKWPVEEWPIKSSGEWLMPGRK